MDRKLGGLNAWPVAVMTAVLIALSGCDEYAKHEVQKQVQAQLKDPESARFSDITVAGRGLVGCGTVNAKNSMGGYVGDRAFMVWQDRVYLDESDSAPNLAGCCEVMKAAVTSRKSSSELVGFKQSCGDLVGDFAWPRNGQS